MKKTFKTKFDILFISDISITVSCFSFLWLFCSCPTISSLKTVNGTFLMTWCAPGPTHSTSPWSGSCPQPLRSPPSSTPSWGPGRMIHTRMLLLVALKMLRFACTVVETMRTCPTSSTSHHLCWPSLFPLSFCSSPGGPSWSRVLPVAHVSFAPLTSGCRSSRSSLSLSLRRAGRHLSCSTSTMCWATGAMVSGCLSRSSWTWQNPTRRWWSGQCMLPLWCIPFYTSASALTPAMD